MSNIENSVDQAYQDASGTNSEATVTYSTNGTHSTNSLHSSGNAVDLRTRDLTEEQRTDFASRLADELGEDYDVINEGDHIHCEYDP
jgi:D-alanyl-D-alanine dipeptidase